MVLLITDDDLAKIEIPPEDYITVVEDCYRQDGLGLTQETPRLEVKVKGKDLPHIAPGTTSVGQGLAFLEESGLLVASQSFHFDFHKYLSHILDPESGETLAIIKRGRAPFGVKPKTISSGGLRTGAAAAVGAKYLARDKIETVGVVGTGRIGQASLLCMSKVADFQTVLAHSGRKKDPQYNQMMGELLGMDITAAESVEEVVRKADILITATFAEEPIIKGEWFMEGTFVAGMGADGPKKAEMDPAAFQRASKVYIDSEKCLSIKEIARPMKEGLLRPEDITGRIGETVAGIKPGRENEMEITIFESDGTHMQSAAVVGLLYQKVKEAGLGTEITDLPNFSFFLNP